MTERRPADGDGVVVREDESTSCSAGAIAVRGLRRHRTVAAELRCSRRRIVSASTPSRDGNTPRTARARARAAARRPPCDITWRYAQRRGSAAVPPSPPLFASPHNTRYVFGRQCCALGHALMHGGYARACCAPTPTSACTQPHCVCAHVRLRLLDRLARGNTTRLRHFCRHAFCVLKLVRGLAVVVPVSHRSQARQGRCKLLRKP